MLSINALTPIATASWKSTGRRHPRPAVIPFAPWERQRLRPIVLSALSQAQGGE